MAFVYWLHKPEDVDFLTSGYIGVTSRSVAQRYDEHKRAAEGGADYIVHKAIRKYGDILVMDVLVEGETSYCYDVEAKLRPSYGIGYNCAAGGESPNMLGMKHSEETRKKISEKVSGDKHPLYGKPVPEDRKLKMSTAQKGDKSKAFGKPRSDGDKAKMREWAANNPHPFEGLLPWELPKTRKEVWVKAEEVFAFFTPLQCGVRKVAKHFGGTDSAYQTLYNKIKSGWNPSEDLSYLAWLEKYNKIKECPNGT
ncbi:MAG: NUMOD3 domain-containing DNA-binding protein [Halobacteriota archaeon]